MGEISWDMKTFVVQMTLKAKRQGGCTIILVHGVWKIENIKLIQR